MINQEYFVKYFYLSNNFIIIKINELLRDSLGSLPDEIFSIRRISAVSIFLISVVDWDRQSAMVEQRSLADREKYLQWILDFAASGMIAS